ncbi:MAG: argininosuccinate lyase [Enterocloster aldenensis]
MRKQTKLVAVLSTAALLAIGASMTSFAAQGWAEEDGTWVYYDRNGDRVTDKWAKSGNNWYYLDSDGEMAIDTLIDDGDNYYYVDINGVMASNQWVAIENEDAGDDNEPDHYWYYFQANGKALTNGNNTSVSLKTINGKKYAFDTDGKMLYGWVSKDNAERIDNSNNDAFKDADYYFGGEDDGAMTVGWLQADVTYEEATNDYEIAPVFNDDEDQTRWFYFQSNGKMVKADPGKFQKSKTINGKKYEFDENGAMTAEWSLDVKAASDNGTRNSYSTSTANNVSAKYAQQWRYFNSVEDGARVSKGWFKVVPAEYLNSTRYNDDEDAWYYADGSGNLYAGEFKTIKGKKYAFRDDGRMLDGLKFIRKTSTGLDVMASDGSLPYETEGEFDASATKLNKQNYLCYYFGDSSDGAMKTGKSSIDIDGDKFNFYFETAGSNKGAGKTGEKDKKLYQSGKLLTAGKDEKYQVVEAISTNDEVGYKKYEDAKDFIDNSGIVTKKTGYTDADLTAAHINKKAADVSEFYVVNDAADKFDLVNTSGKVITSNGKNKDGNDYNYVINGKKIVAIYVEN